jgi:hypothetical protein
MSHPTVNSIADRSVRAFDSPLSPALRPGGKAITPAQGAARAKPNGRHAAAGGPPVPEVASFLAVWKGEEVVMRKTGGIRTG